MALQFIIFSSYCIVKGLREVNNYPNNITEHRTTSLLYNKLYVDIQNQFSLPINKREKDHEYLQTKTKEYNEIMLNSLIIRKTISNKYTKFTKNGDISKPLLIGGFDQIEVTVDDQQSPKPTEDAENKLHYEINRWLAHF